MKVYIASRFVNRDVVRSLASQLTNAGVLCVQTWPDEHANCSAVEAATRDIAEINQADAVLLYTEGCESVPGGMHFEAGYAYGQGKSVMVVGPLVHVFCHLPNVMRFATVEDLVNKVTA